MANCQLLTRRSKDVIVDSGRSSLFSQAKIETALAVPVFSGKANTPSFVFSCYSFVRSGSVPFVLKFVQQALRLLWDGLDKVQPHKSVGEDLWKDVAPADLGEMAADVEMQQHFMIKKRPRANSEVLSVEIDHTDSALVKGLQSLSTPSEFQSVRSIYTGSGSSGYDHLDDDDLEPNFVRINYPPAQPIHSNEQQAVHLISDLTPVHQHVATNTQGSKRAHVFIERLDSPVEFETTQSQSQDSTPIVASRDSGFMKAPSPLPMPRPLPLPNASLRQPMDSNGLPNSQQLQRNHVQPTFTPPHPGQSYQTSQAPTQSYQMQNHQQSHAMFLNVDSSTGNIQYQMQIQQAQHHPYQEQQQQENFLGYSSQGHATNNHSYKMDFAQQQHTVTGMSFNADPQQRNQQEQQQYHPLQSSEQLSLPQDFIQSPNFTPQPNGVSQHITMPQSDYASLPNNKISTIGIVFQVPQMQANGSNGHSVGKSDSHPLVFGTNNDSNGDLYCVAINQGRTSSSGGQSGAKVRTSLPLLSYDRLVVSS